MTERYYPPDYCDRETLAYRLSLRPGAIDQLVSRGVIPAPTMIADALRWKWATVEAALDGVRRGMDSAGSRGDDEGDDPFISGARRAAEAATPRSRGHKAA